MNREHIKYAIIGIAIILSAYLLGRAYTYKYRSQDTVVVTGLGETEFESDLIVWSGVLTAEAAEAAGYTQIARLFRATSEAEQVHIAMEYKLVQAEDPEWAKPVADAPVVEACDLNLIAAANGEIYETSDMYPAFIKKAQEEGNDKAVRVFTRAKLAESVHAERYMEAYNNIDAADDDAYFLCPVCGYIEKGDDFEVCPICGAKKSAFKQF